MGGLAFSALTVTRFVRKRENMSTSLKVEQIKKKYRCNIYDYDLLDLPFRRLCEQVIARLALQEGEIVLWNGMLLSWYDLPEPELNER